MDFYLDNNNSLKERWTWIESVENIYDYYESHDVLIIPSIYEGLPLVLCEAMLSGWLCNSFICLRSSQDYW